ncbi:hypothetical protein Esti_004982 [Eimeria stiedai]
MFDDVDLVELLAHVHGQELLLAVDGGDDVVGAFAPFLRNGDVPVDGEVVTTGAPGEPDASQPMIIAVIQQPVRDTMTLWASTPADDLAHGGRQPTPRHVDGWRVARSSSPEGRRDREGIAAILEHVVEFEEEGARLLELFPLRAMDRAPDHPVDLDEAGCELLLHREADSCKEDHAKERGAGHITNADGELGHLPGAKAGFKGDAAKDLHVKIADVGEDSIGWGPWPVSGAGLEDVGGHHREVGGCKDDNFGPDSIHGDPGACISARARGPCAAPRARMVEGSCGTGLRGCGGSGAVEHRALARAATVGGRPRQPGRLRGRRESWFLQVRSTLVLQMTDGLRRHGLLDSAFPCPNGAEQALAESRPPGPRGAEGGLKEPVCHRIRMLLLTATRLCLDRWRHGAQGNHQAADALEVVEAVEDTSLVPSVACDVRG